MTEWHLMSYLCSGEIYRRFAHPTLTAADGRQIAALTPDFLGPHVFTKMLEMLEADDVAGPLSDPAFVDPRSPGPELRRGLAGPQASGRRSTTPKSSTGWARGPVSPGA